MLKSLCSAMHGIDPNYIYHRKIMPPTTNDCLIETGFEDFFFQTLITSDFNLQNSSAVLRVLKAEFFNSSLSPVAHRWTY